MQHAINPLVIAPPPSGGIFETLGQMVIRLWGSDSKIGILCLRLMTDGPKDKKAAALRGITALGELQLTTDEVNTLYGVCYKEDLDALTDMLVAIRNSTLPVPEIQELIRHAIKVGEPVDLQSL